MPKTRTTAVGGQRAVETIANDEVLETRRDLLDVLVEVMTKREVGEGEGKRGEPLVEVVAEGEASDRGGEARHLFPELAMKHEALHILVN